jgi:hypothetical protein
MKWGPAIVLLIMFPAQVYAQAQYTLQPRINEQIGPATLMGTWGTAEQCAAHGSGDNEDPRLFPYLITGDWIRQGFIYCYLSWQDHINDADGTRAQAVAQCGEDSLRDYQIFLRLNNNKLEIRWSKDFTTPMLQACK